MSDALGELLAKINLDQDVRVQLAGMLRAGGVDVATTRNEGNLGAGDEEQLEFAVATGRAIITHNRLDYEALFNACLESEKPHYGILIAPQRHDLHVTRDRILELLNRLDREQLRNGLFYV